MAKTITYIASKTGAKFHRSQKVVRGFMGPVGNGKSVTCINELHRIAICQAPNAQGIRKTRFAIVRNTYDMLETTTLATFKQWFPPEICSISHKPMRADIGYKLPDGTRIECHVIFLAVDRPDDVKKMLSLEVTAIFLNEAKELPWAVVKAARERIGRYPSRIDGYDDTPTYSAPRDESGDLQPCTRKALLMDTNPPDDTHWWYQLAELGSLKEDSTAESRAEVSRVFDFFRGPSPLIREGDKYIPNPEAENIKFLPGGYQYYLDMIAGTSEDHINVMVMGNYGTIATGKPVYPQYNDRLHCASKPLGLLEDLPIGLGWDFGLTPACIVGQLHNGQLRVVGELFAESMGVREFARDIVKPWLERNCKGIEIAFSYGDPTGNNRGEGIGRSAIGILNDNHTDDDGITMEPLNLGFYTEPAPTNDPTQRIDAVSRYMLRLVGGEPAYQLSPRCKMLRAGKQGGYQYKRIQTSGEKFKDVPDKNIYSHVSDAEQYLALGFNGMIFDNEQFYDTRPRITENVMGY